MVLPRTTLIEGYVFHLDFLWFPINCVASKPIPLDILTLANLTDPTTQRGAGIRGGQQHGGDQSASDSQAVYPCTIHQHHMLPA